MHGTCEGVLPVEFTLEVCADKSIKNLCNGNTEFDIQLFKVVEKTKI